MYKKLNQKLVSASILCLLTITLAAQDSDEDVRGDVSFGVKAGVNYANVWDEQGQDFNADPRLGFAGGLFLGIPIGKYLGVQPEALLSQKGLQGSGSLLGATYSFTRTTTYVDIPLQLQIKPLEVLTLLAGPQYSYLINEKSTYTLGDLTIGQEEAFESDDIRKNVLGFVAGADILIKHVVVSGRVGWDLQNNNGDGTSSTPRYKNRWLQFTVGFKL